MKKLYAIFMLTVFFSLFNNSYAAISTPSAALGMRVSTPTVTKPTKLDLSKLSIAEIEAKLGHKLTWKQKLAVKLAKAKGGDGNFGKGFLLGFFVGIVGVILAYVIFEDEVKTRKGAWWGFAINAIIGIIFLVIYIAALSTL
jgi:uncharacterized membrane protein YeaQ/YmgE (transglycosylase-associated protein family)